MLYSDFTREFIAKLPNREIFEVSNEEAMKAIERCAKRCEPQIKWVYITRRYKPNKTENKLN